MKHPISAGTGDFDPSPPPGEPLERGSTVDEPRVRSKEPQWPTLSEPAKNNRELLQWLLSYVITDTKALIQSLSFIVGCVIALAFMLASMLTAIVVLLAVADTYLDVDPVALGSATGAVIVGAFLMARRRPPTNRDDL